jgi:hypothetical protein
MARRPRAIIDIVHDHDRQLEAIRAAELRRMNERAARSIANNAAVISSGAIDNATKAVRPVLAANAQRQRKGWR